MKLMEGKKGIIFGVSNTHGIAYAIAIYYVYLKKICIFPEYAPPYRPPDC